MLGVVLFPPGSGGNHLRNILDSFWNKEIHQNYLNSEKNVDWFEKYDLSDPDNIFGVSHMNMYVKWLQTEDILNRKVFLMSTPGWDSVARSRMAKLYPLYTDLLFFADMSTLYTLQFLDSLYPKPDVFNIDSELLWNKDIGPLMDWIEANTPIKLDRDHCKFIHTKWCDKVGL